MCDYTFYPYCTECYNNRDNEDFKLCEKCKEFDERSCWSCIYTFDTKEEGDVIDNTCKHCREVNR